ncbi:caspase family protein [bacterium]|nr:caspase family protein [bacterium]
MTKRTGLIILILIVAIVVPLAGLAEERYALLVGINKYNSSRISELKGAVNDVVGVGAALTQFCGFDQTNVYYLSSDRDADHQPYKTNIASVLEHLAKMINSEDAFFFYFSGHGVTQNNEQYLLTQEANVNSANNIQMSCLALGDLHSMLDRIRASKKVIIVDACRNKPVLAAKGDGVGTKLSAAFSKGLTMTPKPGRGGISFSAVLYACKPDHVAYEYPGENRGFFSYFLTQALSGAAEALNRNGDLTLGGIDAYLKSTVNAAVIKELRGQAEQIPWIDNKGSGFNTWRLARFKPGVGRPFQAVPGVVPGQQGWLKTNAVALGLGAGSLLIVLILLVTRRFVRPARATVTSQASTISAVEEPKPAVKQAAERIAAVDTESPAPVIPPPPPKPGRIGDVDKLIEAKKHWALWQAKMADEFQRLLDYEQNEHLGPKDRAELWENFLDGFSASNPYSDQDKELRKVAGERVDFWAKRAQAVKKKATIAVPPPPPRVEVSR